MAIGRPVGIRLSAAPLFNALDQYGIEVDTLNLRTQAALRKGKFKGFFTLNMADEIACTVLSLHPFFVWGEEYETAVWFDMDDMEEAA